MGEGSAGTQAANCARPLADILSCETTAQSPVLAGSRRPGGRAFAISGHRRRFLGDKSLGTIAQNPRHFRTGAQSRYRLP